MSVICEIIFLKIIFLYKRNHPNRENRYSVTGLLTGSSLPGSGTLNSLTSSLGAMVVLPLLVF